MNRRGRTIDSSWRKVSDSTRLQSNSKMATENMRSIKPTSFTANTAANPAATVAMTPRIQDPADIELKRGRRTKQKKEKRQRKFFFKKPLTLKRGILRGFYGLILIGVIVGGFLGFKFFQNIDKVFGGNPISNLSALFNSTPLNGESSGRVNILLAGDSSDQIGHGGADLTDSILILSVDTKNHTAFLLSIPRDLWVNIPTLGYQKINAANDVTSFSQNGFPSGGMGQLQEIVQNDLGIPIDYYALSDYTAFSNAVDAVGGVRVDIQSPDPRGLYDPNVKLDLPNGWVTLNGQTALNLARARGDGYGSYGFPDSDFDRTQHQRQIFTAIVSKAQTLGFLDNPVKISDLFNAFGNNVETNLTLQNVLRLDTITKGINLNNIKSYAYCSTLTIGDDGCTNAVLTTYTDPYSGQEALIPTEGIGDYSQLAQYYQKLTSNNPIVKEGASVIVLNGGNTEGLAGDYKTYLATKQITVDSVADASEYYPTTEIMDDSSGADPNTLAELKAVFGTNVVANNPYVNPSGANFVVILGTKQGLPAGSSGSSTTGSSTTGSSSQ
jgi:LCP family protein required for cell wall assembly